jgi:hypothetical protein
MVTYGNELRWGMSDKERIPEKTHISYPISQLSNLNLSAKRYTKAET